MRVSRWLPQLLLVACAKHTSYVVASGRNSDRPPCFEQDAHAVAEALGANQSSILPLETPKDFLQLRQRIADADSGLTVLLAAHGLPEEMSILEGSGIPFNGDRQMLSALFRLPRKDIVPWMVVLADGCSSSWVDLRTAQVPSSLVSFSNQEMVADCRPYPPFCQRASDLAESVAAALEGAADSNKDCLVTDLELADYVNDKLRKCTPANAEPAYLRVAWQANGHIPIARLPACTNDNEHNYTRIEKIAQELGGDIEMNLRLQLAIIRGTRAPLPQTDSDYYVAAGTVPGLSEAARLLRLRPFPGNLETAEVVARFSTSIGVYLVESSGDRYCTTRLPRSSVAPVCGTLTSVSDRDGLMSLLPSRAEVEDVFPSRNLFRARFMGRVTNGPFAAGRVWFDLRHAAATTCKLHGQCFEIPFDPHVGVPVGTPIRSEHL